MRNNNGGEAHIKTLEKKKGRYYVKCGAHVKEKLKMTGKDE